MAQLAVWDNFYTIIGSAAATLTGLMFVVVTLTPSRPVPRTGEITNTFSTPTIVHFASALGIAALVCAPWRVLWLPGVLLGLSGLAGLLYMRVVVRRWHRQTDYRPVLEDQLWHMLFPLLAYGALVVAALVCVGSATPALFLVAAAAILLLFIGIHNAWDSVTFIVFTFPSQEQDGQNE